MSGPVGYPAEGFDLANTAIQANPYPAYAWLRANAPVYRLRDVPMWVVSRHQEVEAVLRDPATFASDLGMSVPIMSIVMKDAPDHTRLRGTINRAFTPRAVQHLEPRITEVAHQLLDCAGGRMEFVHGYATPLSVTVICEMLGVPLAQRDAMNRHARDALLASFAATGMGSAELLAEARVGLDRLMAILDAAIEQHLRAPADNIISTLVVDEAKGVLTREELRNLCALLLIGGHETTANLMASGAWILAETPELWARLKQEPALIARFVEELARMRPPLQRIARRTTRAGDPGRRRAAGQRHADAVSRLGEPRSGALGGARPARSRARGPWPSRLRRRRPYLSRRATRAHGGAHRLRDAARPQRPPAPRSRRARHSRRGLCCRQSRLERPSADPNRSRSRRAHAVFPGCARPGLRHRRPEPRHRPRRDRCGDLREEHAGMGFAGAPGDPRRDREAACDQAAAPRRLHRQGRGRAGGAGRQDSGRVP